MFDVVYGFFDKLYSDAM